MDAALKEEKNYTINDIYSLPDGERAELFDGQIYYMAPPSWTHQKISRKLQQAIANYIDNSNGSCEVLAAPFAVFLNDEDLKTYLEPDLSVICDRKKLDDKGCHGAPDWVIEIVSPMSRSRDYIKKMITYHMAGVREYWIVDPEEKLVTVYGFAWETMRQYAFGKEIPVHIFADLSIKVEC